MELPKPPKDYYSLEEIIEHLGKGWKIEDLFDYNELGSVRTETAIFRKYR